MSHITGARDHFFKEETIDNTDFEKDATHDWEFQSKGILIQNDSRQTIYYSFNGQDIDGSIKPSDKWIALDKITKSRIWLKTSSAVASKSAYRITAWRGEV